MKIDEWQNKEECVRRVTWLNHTYLFSHAVKFVGQFMFAPPLLFMVVVQRIIQYLQGIIEQGLLFPSQSTIHLNVYSDIDWAACPDTRQSTTAKGMFLGFT